MAFTSKFPLEIIETIIDSLATEDVSLSSVKSCSLVSRRLLPCTRTRIFKTISLNYSNRDPIPSMFERLISRTPAIAYYVTSLTYRIKHMDATAVGFAAALNKLTCLESLDIGIDAFRLQWNYIPFKEPILNLMHLPTLSHLKLSHILNFHLSDLTLCIGLKCLEVQSLERPEIGDNIEIYQEQPPILDSYIGKALYEHGSLLSELCSACRSDGKPIVDITALKELSLEINKYERNSIEEIFKRCTHLTDVHLTSLSNSLLWAEFFIPSLQTLRYIHLESDTNYPGHGEDLIPSLIHNFALFPCENIIETIKISIVVCRGLVSTYGKQLGVLDQVITQSSGWKKLRSFSLHLKVEIFLGESADVTKDLLEGLEKLPETQLQGLATSRDILFDFDVPVIHLGPP